MGIGALVGAVLTGGAGLTGAAAFGAATARFVLTYAATSLIAKKLAPSGPSIRSRSVTSRGTVDAEAIIYGEAVVGGTLAYRNALGQRNRELWAVHCLAGHECEAILGCWIEDREITNTAINNGDPAGGAVLSGDFGPVGDRGTSAAEFWKHLGTDTQAANAELVAVSPDWTAAHQLRGIAYVASNFVLWDKTEELWNGSDPSNVRFRVRGKKVYDPRLDSTNGGTGTQRADDKATWEWSTNPALCTVDMLRDPKFSPLIGGIVSASIDWPAVITAADDCDVLVDVPGGTQERFTCNGVIYGSASPEDNLKSLLSCFNGNLVFSGGLYTVLAGVWAAPTDTLAEQDIIGTVSYKSALSSDQRVNTMKATYVDKDKQYEPAETAAIAIQAFVDRDGGVELINSIELAFTDTWYEAQRLCLQRLKEANEEKTLVVPCNLRAARLVPGQRVNLTITERGWTPKTFKVIDWEMFDRGANDVGVNVTLREDEASAYADPVESDYNTLAANGTITLADPQIIPSVDTIPRDINYGVGTWSIRLTANKGINGVVIDGAIRILPGRFVLPDDTIRTVTDDTRLLTPFEAATRPPDGVFYMVWGAESVVSRFPTGSFGEGGVLGFFSAIYDRFAQQWYAVNDENLQVPFTPLSTDYVVARGTKSTTTGGIDYLTPVVQFVQDGVLTGTAAGQVAFATLTGETFATNVADPTDATTGLQVGTNGALIETNNGVTGTSQAWLSIGAASLCEVRATASSGTVTSGTVGSWLPMTSNRVWTKAQTVSGVGSVTLLIEVREIANTSNITSASYVLSSTVTAAKPVLTARTNQTFATTVTDPQNASTQARFTSGGVVQELNNGVVDFTANWLTSGAAADCEVMATVLSGTVAGTTGTWLPLTSDQTWTKAQNVVGTSVAQLRIQVREIADPANNTSADYTLGSTVLS